MVYQVQHFINGSSQTSSNKTLPIYNPATGQTIGQVQVADINIINQAVMAARNAFPAWSITPPLKRSRILFKFKSLLEQNIDALAAIVTREHGKTLNDARGSVQRGIDVVEFACAIPTHLQGKYSERVASDIDCYSIRQPVGVCLGITPFNFPCMIPLWMFTMAIACGNTFVLKPSEKDPSCAIKLVELAKEAGIPDGVVNVVQGDKDTVQALLTHPNIHAVSFVGSTAVAEQVFHTATTANKRVQAFGGAKNHAVVMPDADLEEVANAVVGAAYGSAGERCMAISVVIAVADVADELIQCMIPKIRNLKIGNGDDVSAEMGPLITNAHWQRVNDYIESGIKNGANLIVDGRKTQLPKQGFFMGGSLFDQVTPEMAIYREEIFGPVLSVVRVPDLATALQLINQHEYGNGTAIFTRDGYTAHLFAASVQVGMVGINIPIPVPVAYHSFGGWKRSVFGDIGMYGQESVNFYTKLKTVTERWIKDDKGLSLHMPTYHGEESHQ